MIMELVAEKEYLDDRLRVSQGLVESSQELTSEKQQRIDELEKQLRMEVYKYQNELASMRAQVHLLLLLLSTSSNYSPLLVTIF